MSRTPLIFEIKGNALDDGPGIRTVVFFKGCPLACAWCHNPESIKPELEISFDKNVCIGCRQCIAACKAAALSPDNPYYIDREKCVLCMDCADVCPSGALTQVGKVMAVEEVYAQIAKDAPFFKTSGGGVTLSGGEATLFMDFAAQLARLCQDSAIPVLLETNGLFPYERFMELLYPHLSLIYFDLKIMDSAQHKRYCGVDNTIILDNFSKLNRLYQEGGIEILPRLPLIPGISASTDNLEALAEFLRLRQVKRLALLPNNPLWGEKLAKLGADAAALKAQGLYAWMKQDELRSYAEIFKEFELV